jgi:hypothetical protein
LYNSLHLLLKVGQEGEGYEVLGWRDPKDPSLTDGPGGWDTDYEWSIPLRPGEAYRFY